jgi:Xaa-Pro aminopeptidase
MAGGRKHRKAESTSWFSSTLLALACCGVSFASASTADPDYRVRREALRQAVSGAIVLSGRTETEKDRDTVAAPFFQEPNFYYLTGWREPGARLLINASREILFLPGHDPKIEKWTGPRHTASDPDITAISGFDAVKPLERFDEEVHAAGAAADPAAVEKALARLRMRKSPAEVGLIDRAVDATVAAHLAAWRRIAPGLYEYQLAALMQGLYFDRGCERNAYAPIVASGPNGVYLHYDRNARRIQPGELVLMDVGAECAGYAADVTRTVPASGHFTPRQRELYQIVLGAQKAAIAAVKPGMTIGSKTPHSIYQAAYHYLNTRGRDLHGEPLGKYFTHGISHHIGLEVHDASDPNAPLEEGMLISVEPGLYIPEEQIGIRIEDMILVTATGARVLTTALPREAAEIERIVSSPRTSE